MPDRKLIEKYLAEANVAEQQAAKCAEGSVMKEGWLRIAFAYRDMARVNGYKG